MMNEQKKCLHPRQFDKEYYADPAIKLVTTHSSTLLGYENATISYASSNTEVITITDGVLNTVDYDAENDKLIFVWNIVEGTNTDGSIKYKTS